MVHKHLGLHSFKDDRLFLMALIFMVGLGVLRRNIVGSIYQLIIIHYIGVNIALFGKLGVLDACQMSFSRQKVLR